MKNKYEICLCADICINFEVELDDYQFQTIEMICKKSDEAGKEFSLSPSISIEPIIQNTEQ